MVRQIFSVRGSVFPQASLISLPSAVVTYCFVHMIYTAQVEPFASYRYENEEIFNNNAIWGGFSFLVGFLVVFRTSQAYARFWEGCTSTHKMGAEWFDCCSSLMAFCKFTSGNEVAVLAFQNTMVRLFSMLHAVALGEIEDCGDDTHFSEVAAFSMQLLDAEAFDAATLIAVRDSNSKVELVFQWIQQLVVENFKAGVLTIPPPILSRSFQEIANGMVHFHDAMKISNVPFPFPYAQTCDCLLFLHWFLVPFIVSQWVVKPWWAAVFSFIQVFTFWTLNLIAVELENPFGLDPNDIDGDSMQMEFNTHVRLLLTPEALNTPRLEGDMAEQERLKRNVVAEGPVTISFRQAWQQLDDTVIPQRRASEAVFRREKASEKAELRNSNWSMMGYMSYVSTVASRVRSRYTASASIRTYKDLKARETNQQADSNPSSWSVKGLGDSDITCSTRLGDLPADRLATHSNAGAVSPEMVTPRGTLVDSMEAMTWQSAARVEATPSAHPSTKAVHSVSTGGTLLHSTVSKKDNAVKINSKASIEWN